MKLFKKCMVISIGLLCAVNTVFADSLTPSVMMDGKKIMFKNKPYIENERTMVPFSAFAEKIDVDFVTSDNEISVFKNGVMIDMYENDDNFKVNGIGKKTDTNIAVAEDEIYVPVRFIGEYLGYQVDWDEENAVVTIKQATDETTHLIATENDFSSNDVIFNKMKATEEEITLLSAVNEDFMKANELLISNIQLVQDGKARPFYEIVKEYTKLAKNGAEAIVKSEAMLVLTDKEKAEKIISESTKLAEKYAIFMDTYGDDKELDLVYWAECRELIANICVDIADVASVYQSEMKFKKAYLENAADNLN